MTTTTLIATRAYSSGATGQSDTESALRFITCGSVDDGKSTLIGRLLVDSRSVLQDQLAGVQRGGAPDLALLTDGLAAEREQGITIDVAWRYFATARRKFIIGDAPGHEQYTRNMVTAASSADAAVVLVDATKLDAHAPGVTLLAQTRRHALLAALLRVPSLVFAVNKLDAVPDAATAFAHIRAALQTFAQDAGLAVRAIVPISALQGWNVVEPRAGWCDYIGPSLLTLLEDLPVASSDVNEPFALPVQWVEKPTAQTETAHGRRVFWGRVAAGTVAPGQAVTVLPGGQRATVVQVLDHVRQSGAGRAGASVGLVLDRELDISRGDWLLAPGAHAPTREIEATLAWLDDEPLTVGRVHWALHGHRWVKARVTRIAHRLDVNTLAEEDASELPSNAIGHVTLALQEPLAVRPYAQSRALGALVLVDSATHRTSAAVLVR